MGRVPERTGVGGKWATPSGGVGLRASSTIVGLHFAAVAAGGGGYAGSVPIAGKVQLEGVWLVAGITVGSGELHQFQLAIATEIPASQADMDAGEQLFPRASTLAGEGSTLLFGLWGGGMVIPVTTLIAMNGRRFIGRVTNRHGATASTFYVGLVLHRVIGGSTAGDPPFLLGEEVELR